MQDILDLIKTRRATRKYKNEAVPQDLIQKVVEAGLWAASGMNYQSSVIIAITKPELRAEISKVNAQIMGKQGVDPFYGAPVYILVVGKKEFKNAVYDGSLAIGNMMLEAHALGLATCWINRAREGVEQYDLYTKLLQDLKLDGEYIGIGHLALGYPESVNNSLPPRKENRAFFIE